MKTDNARCREYAGIRTMSDLQYQKRLLKSRIEHQEVMIMYRGRSLWDFISPSHLAMMGLEALSAHNSAFGTFYRAAEFVTQLIRSKVKKK